MGDGEGLAPLAVAAGPQGLAAVVVLSPVFEEPGIGLRDAVAQIRNEPDLSYNNILRSIEKDLGYRYADARIWCARP